MTGRDQLDLWIRSYGDDPGAPAGPSAFVTLCLAHLEPHSRILELGCGGGADAETFARAGHTVTATDFVPAVIHANRARLTALDVEYRQMRIDEPYPFADAAFDAVYAHLTLHYFPDDLTRRIFWEIHRVLAPGGLLMFACKSPADPAHGRGIEIEPDMFDLHGKVRHFFSEAYVRELLADGYDVIVLESHRGQLYRQRAGWITAIARSAHVAFVGEG